MRWLVLVGVLVALAEPGYAAEKMTVAQLEQMVAQHATRPREPAKKQNAASDEIIDISDGDLLGNWTRTTNSFRGSPELN